MNTPTSNSVQKETAGRMVGVLDPSRQPDGVGYVRAVYVGGLGQDPSKPVVAWASDLTFDIVVNSIGGGPSSVAEGVTFANPTPKNDDGSDAYKIVVEFGARVGVMSLGRFDEFSIPWLPYVKPCPGSAASRSGGGHNKQVPAGSAGGGSTDNGGGSGVPTQGGGTAGGQGSGNQGSPVGGGGVPP